MSTETEPLTLRVAPAGEEDVPVIIEDPSRFPFAPGERERWRPATAAEYQAYLDYWNVPEFD